jgi:hypothetical protein
MQTAWLETDEKLLIFATEDTNDDSIFGSALTRLIYGVSTAFGEERLRYLRKRILTTGRMTLWEKNLIKVCAKRASTVSEFRTDQFNESKYIDIGATMNTDTKALRRQDLIGAKLLETPALDILRLIANEDSLTAQNEKLKQHQRSRPISAIICDDNDTVLAIAVNTNASCQMRHAEVNLFLQLRSQGIRKLPAGSKIYTSLKPCRMCAALILEYACDLGQGHTRVVALEDDLGPMGRHRLLDGMLQIQG